MDDSIAAGDLDDHEDDDKASVGPPPEPWWPASRVGRVLVGCLLVASVLLLIPFARRGDWLAVLGFPAASAAGVLIGRYVRKRDPYS